MSFHGYGNRSNYNRRGKGFQNSQKKEDFDDDLGDDLRKALEKYRRNVPKNHTSSVSTSQSHERKKTNPNNEPEPFEKVVNLINFFVPQNNVQLEKTYSDYEKQGAIPKNRHIPRTNTKHKIPNVSSKPSKPPGKTLLNHSGREIQTVSKEICKEPFFYVVPENPSPNFVFSPGSYYIIPKSHNLKIGKVVIFHPEIKTPNVLSWKTKTPIDTSKGSNNLGKEAQEKKDSHLNIGPSDVKVEEFFRNLISNCEDNKNIDKDLLEVKKLNIEKEEENIECEYFSWLDDNPVHVGNDEEEEEISSLVQKLMSEFPEMDIGYLRELASKHVTDELGLEGFIASERLKIKKNEQFERMILSLPEASYEELRRKFEELEGDEELITDYIQQAQLNDKRQKLIMEVLSIFPDIDPEYLEREIRNREGNDLNESVTHLTMRLLEENSYPRIPLRVRNLEKENLWRMYVEEFNVENYLLEVPNPIETFEVAGDKKNEKLLYEFFSSIFPFAKDSSYDLLGRIRQENYNMTKVFDVLVRRIPLVPFSKNLFLSKEVYDEKFLKEFVFMRNRTIIKDYLKVLETKRKCEISECKKNNSFLCCPLCFDNEVITSEAFTCPDGHVFCSNCIKRYISTRISDGIYKYICPDEECDAFFSYSSLQKIIPGSVLSRIIKKQQAEEIKKANVDGLECCPHCEFAYIPNPEEKLFICQNSACLVQTCRSCGEDSHIPLRCEEVKRPKDIEARRKIEETMTKQLIRICPTCSKSFVKVGGCNKMVCTCGTIICYLCRQKIDGYRHFGTKCVLYSNNDNLHRKNVRQAGIAARNQILRETPDVHLLYDPEKDDLL